MKISNILKTAAVLVAAVAVASCGQKKFHVEGNITQAQDSMLYLENVGLQDITVIDSVRLDADGAFAFSGEAGEAPEFYRLRIHDQIINISIDSTETVSVKAAYPTMITQYEVNGSDNCLKIKELAIKQIQLQQQAIAISNAAGLTVDQANDSILNLISQYKQDVTANYIYREPNKTYAYFALFQTLGNMLIFNPRMNHDDVRAFAAVATSWDNNYPDAVRTQNLHNIALNSMKNERIVAADNQRMSETEVQTTGLIDIALTDNKGQQRSLNDLKGKVVLLDFHLFSLSDSPKRILALRELYNKFSAQGFEIYQVSLDGDVHFWKQQTQALPWICVRDADGTASPRLQLYNVQTLPDFFLIDRNSNLVKRMAQITDLEAEIRRLL